MKKIVIIEDDKILREELEILLNDSGYQAEILSDFTDAAAQVRQIRPDLVLLDLPSGRIQIWSSASCRTGIRT